MQYAYLGALAEPTRLRIVELLRERPCSVSEIVSSLHINQPQASKHLKYLAKAGIVTVRPIAQQRIYALQAEPFMELSEWANSFERQWNTKLDSLDEYLNKLKKGSYNHDSKER